MSTASRGRFWRRCRNARAVCLLLPSTAVTFPAGAWTRDTSHDEMIRSGIDQNLEIDPGHLQYLYQGMDPGASGAYSRLPWWLGPLPQTNATC